MVADFQARHALSDRLDDARRLVAIDRRQIAAPGAVDVKNVAVANRAGRGPYQHLARPRFGKVDRLDGQGRAEGAADGGFGFHGAVPAETSVCSEQSGFRDERP